MMDCKFSRCYCFGVYEILMIIIDKSMLTVKRGMEHRDAHIVGLSLKLITNMKS